MAADQPAARPVDTEKVRARLRAVWLPLWLAAAAGCVLVGMYGDTQIFLSLFLFLAALLVLGGVRSFGCGLDVDGNGVVVRTSGRQAIPRRELAAIESGGLGGRQQHVLQAGLRAP
jgi:hypothetical protein